MNVPQRATPLVIWGYFVLGLASVVLFRLIPILNHLNLFWGHLAWYGAVISSMIFFGRRGNVSKRRLKLVRERQLVEKVEGRKPLSEEDYETLHYILWSNQVSKEWVNYLAIFILSLVALVIAFILDVH